MQKLIKTIALGTVLLLTVPAQAENLVEIYQKALRNDPALREAEATMRAEMELKPQARSLLLPSLSASVGGQLDTTDGSANRPVSIRDPMDPGPDDDPNFITSTQNVPAKDRTKSRNWSVDFRQALFDLDAWRRLKKSSKEVARAQSDFRTAQQDLLLRVSEAYFNVLAAQDNLIAEQASKEAIGRQLEQAERRFEVGLIAITDVKESQAAYDDAIALVIEAQRALATSKEALREITGEYPGTLAAPGEEFPLVAPEPAVEQDWVDISLQQNTELESAKINAEITRDNIEIEKSGYLPTLELSASVGNFRRRGTSTSFSQADPPEGRPSDIDIDSDQQTVGLQFNVPIFTGGNTTSRVQEAVYRHRASRENYERVARETEREARDAYLGVIAEIARVQALARSVESNLTALEATEAGYEVGTRTTVDVLNSRDALFRAQTQYARAKYDYLINVVKLKQAAGIASAADIEDINSWLETDAVLQETPGRGGVPDAQLEETTVPSNPDASDSAQ